MNKEYMPCFLEKMESTHNNLRTDTIEGYTYQEPVIGENFVMYGKGLDFGVRYIHTTPVKEIRESDGGVVFKTANSTYFFKRISDEQDTPEKTAIKEKIKIEEIEKQQKALDKL